MQKNKAGQPAANDALNSTINGRKIGSQSHLTDVLFVGATALMVAAAKGKLDTVLSLLSHGSDPLQKAKDGSIASDWAHKFNQQDVAEFLAEHIAVSSFASALPQFFGTAHNFTT